MTGRNPGLRVLIIVGYFDWFSGYQETVLASGFADLAATEIIASDRVNPAFSDEHLSRIGVGRRYAPGSRTERGVTVTRFATRELRSMVWSSEVRDHLRQREYDLIVQVMPGQALPVAASLGPSSARRVVLYGDNRAMWANLSPGLRLLKGVAFAMSKGVIYAFVSSRAHSVHGYTEDTVSRLRPFSAGKPIALMPLGFDEDTFFLDRDLRTATRRSLDFGDDDVVLLSAGKFARPKRLEWLVTAFDQLALRRPALRLVLVGADDSDYSREIKAAVARSSAASRIRVLSFTDARRLNAVFNAADVAVWPRMPAITIQQAMGTGLPVVLPRNDLVGHLVRPGDETGTYVDLLPGEEARRIGVAVLDCVDRFDLGATAREQRVHRNSWLSAGAIVRDLLRCVPSRHVL